jgi:type IX secretion system PorP/SprF family membrane protein
MKKSSFKIIVLIITVLFSFHLESRAQYDAMFTQYMHNEMFINPAYTGSKEALNVTLLDRQQWLGFPGRPITRTLTVNGPVFQNKMGLGISFMNDQIGVLNRNLLYLSYAYRIKTGRKGTLAFGLMGGIHFQKVSLSQVNTIEPGDPAFMTDINNLATPNVGFGMYYYTGKFYAGISIPRMIDDGLVMSGSGNVLKHLVVRPEKFHYYMTVGRIFRTSPDLLIKPQLMIKAVNNAPVELDLNVSALFFEKFWLGVSYRSLADVSAIAGIQLNPQFLISYAYDYQLTEIQSFSSGSHELVLSYLFSYKGQKIVSPRYF